MVKRKNVELGLDKNFNIIGQKPIEDMPKMYALANAMLLSLKDEHIFSITIPSKLQTYLACGKPILGMINGEAAKIVNDNKADIVALGDYKGLAKNILKMTQLNNDKYNQISTNATALYNRSFKRERLLKELTKIF